MKITKKDLAETVSIILAEQDKDKKDKKGKKLSQRVKNTFDKLNVLDIGRKKAEENAKDISKESGVLPNKKDPSALKKEIAAMGMIALSLLKDENAVVYGVDARKFVGTIFGLKLTKPDTYMAAMQHSAIKKAYNKLKVKYVKSKDKTTGGEKTTGSGADAPSVKDSTKPKSEELPADAKEKIKYIQKIVKAPSSQTEKGADGLWGRKTSAAYNAWKDSDAVKTAIEKIKKEKAEGSDKPEVKKENKNLKRLQLRTLLEQMAPIGGEEQSGYGGSGSSQNDDDLADIERMEAEMRKDPNLQIQDDEAGVGDEEPKKKKRKKRTYWKDAAPLAKELGFEGTPEGIAQAVKKINDTIGGDSDEGFPEPPSEEEMKKAMADAKRDDSVWSGKRTIDVNVLNEKLSEKHPEVYNKVPQKGGNCKIKLHKALTRDGAPGLHVSFVKTYDEFQKTHPDKVFSDFIQIEVEYTNAIENVGRAALSTMAAAVLPGIGTVAAGGAALYYGYQAFQDVFGNASKNKGTLTALKRMDDENVGLYKGDGTLDNVVYYDNASKSILYDGVGADYILGKCVIDGEYLYYDEGYKYVPLKSEGAPKEKEETKVQKENRQRYRENRRLFKILKRHDLI